MQDRFPLHQHSASAPAESVRFALSSSGGHSVGVTDLSGPRFVYGRLSIDWCRGSISSVSASVTLLRTELRLLGVLLASEGEPVHSRVLIRTTWPGARYELTKYAALRSYMQSLRRRLQRVGASGKLVRVRGVGYRLVP